MAARFSAIVIEKHFTLDRDMPGPDHRASLEPAELRDMISLLRAGAYASTPITPDVLGPTTKAPTSREIEMAQLVRKSVVAVKDISAGELLTLENLTVKRPGTGLPPKELTKLIGGRARKTISKDALLQMADVEMRPSRFSL
jgi:sialic acid synthase SpsE